MERTGPQCISGSARAKSMRSVDGRLQWASAVRLTAPVHKQSALCCHSGVPCSFPLPLSSTIRSSLLGASDEGQHRLYEAGAERCVTSDWLTSRMFSLAPGGGTTSPETSRAARTGCQPAFKGQLVIYDALQRYRRAPLLPPPPLQFFGRRYEEASSSVHMPFIYSTHWVQDGCCIQLLDLANSRPLLVFQEWNDPITGHLCT